MQKTILIIILLFLYGCAYTNQNNMEKITTSFNQPIKDDEPSPTYKQENNELNEFINKISNVPSPTSNLRYVTQSNNIFQVKYGDGIFILVSNDTYPLRMDCKGISMLPTFDCDDFLIVKKIESRNEFSIGDIIVYKSQLEGQDYLIHRITKITVNGVYTRPDNFQGILKYKNGILELDDGIIKFEDIKYKVVMITYR